MEGKKRTRSPGHCTTAVVQVREDGARGHKGGSDNEEDGGLGLFLEDTTKHGETV